MTEYRVTKSRKAESDNPITVHKGEQVICVEESNNSGDWAGWILCKNNRNSGWIPKQIIDRHGDVGIILEDYNAREFDIEVNEIIVSENTLNGWIWGYKKGSPQVKAWVPLNHAEKVKCGIE